MSARTDPLERAHGSVKRYCHGPDENGIEGKGCRCEDCTDAQRIWMRSHRDANPDYRERQRLAKQAYNRATKTLRARHADEFAHLCAIERGELVEPLPWSALTEADPPLEQMEAEASLMRGRVTSGDPMTEQEEER